MMFTLRRKAIPFLTWIQMPVRTCRSLHHCEICDQDIMLGQRYRDGGYSRRAHETCVESMPSEEAS